MKIKIKVDGLECEAETDYECETTSSNEFKEAIKTSCFVRLCHEVRQIAYNLIEHKYPKKDDPKQDDNG